MIDADLVARQVAPDFLSDYERAVWILSDRNARRRMLNEARWRIVEDARRHEKNLRRVEPEVPVPAVPSQEECQQLLTANPGALDAMAQRARDQFNRVSRLDGAPQRTLAYRWQEFRQAMANQTPARMLQICAEAEAYYIEFGNRDDLALLGWQEAEAERHAVQARTEEANRIRGLIFDPGRYLGQLADRGIVLGATGNGEALRATGNVAALSSTDRDVINAHRAEIIATLRIAEEL
jgi:hypothetical protein